MEIEEKNPPRSFDVKCAVPLVLKDCARIKLGKDEQVTFETETGAEYDVLRTSWGFFATPSTNGRLLSFNLRTLLIKNTTTGRFYVVLCEAGKEPEMHKYFATVSYEVICWLDSNESLDKIEMRLK